jgi:DNA-binding MarR family transcriptional regulator
MKLDTNIHKPDPNQFAGFLVWKTANRWERFINNALKPYGLNQSEMLHLISIFHLLQSSVEISQTQLAHYSGVTTMSVSKILTKLEKMTLITRQTGSDPRSKSINLTQKGIELLIQCAELIRDADSKFYKSKSKLQFINYLTNL